MNYRIICRKINLKNKKRKMPAAPTELALNSLGIRRFADFQAYTPQNLSQALHDRAGISVSADMIVRQDWLVWAAILAAEAAATTVECISTKSEAMENFIAWEDNQDLSESVQTPVPIASDMAAAGSAEAALAQHCEPHHELPKDETVINAMAIRLSEVRFAPIGPQEATAAASAKMLLGEINCELAGISSVSAPLCVQLHAVDTAANGCALLAAKTERLLSNQAAYRFKLEF